MVRGPYKFLESVQIMEEVGSVGRKGPTRIYMLGPLSSTLCNHCKSVGALSSVDFEGRGPRDVGGPVARRVRVSPKETGVVQFRV